MTRRVHSNNCTTVLDGAISNSDTTLTVLNSTGFPTLGAGETFRATLVDSVNNVVEIIEITDASSDPTFVVTRGVEGTSAVAWDDGSVFSIRTTADSHDRKADKTATSGDVIDWGSATSFEIPNSAAPSLTSDGQIALDNTVTDYSNGLLCYRSGSTDYGVIAIKLSDLVSPTDTYIVSYDATLDKFKLVSSGGSGAALTKTDDTNVTLTLGGSPTTALVNATSLTVGWTGQLAVSRGGTGKASVTAYAPIVGGTTSTGALQSTASGSSGQILQSAGNAAVPTWSTPTYPSSSGTSRKILVSDGTNNVYSTETWAVPGSNLNYLKSDGTNWTSAAPTTTPTASTLAAWDSNVNFSANNFLDGYTTTATSAGTKTLSITDTKIQMFTGSTTHTCKLPVVSTLALGTRYSITNLSTGVVTVQSSGTNTVQAMAANTTLIVQSNATTGTGASVWDVIAYTSAASDITGSGSLVRATSPTFVTPVLGTPTSGALTNCTSIPVANATGTLAVANGGTGITVNTVLNAYKNADQTNLTTGAYTKLAFDTEVIDGASYYDNATNFRYLPTVAGTYFVSANCTLTGTMAAGTQVIIAIYKTGNAVAQNLSRIITANSGQSLSICSAVTLNGSSDYVEIFVFQSSGNTLTSLGTAVYNGFTVVRIGA